MPVEQHDHLFMRLHDDRAIRGQVGFTLFKQGGDQVIPDAAVDRVLRAGA